MEGMSYEGLFHFRTLVLLIDRQKLDLFVEWVWLLTKPLGFLSMLRCRYRVTAALHNFERACTSVPVCCNGCGIYRSLNQKIHNACF